MGHREVLFSQGPSQFPPTRPESACFPVFFGIHTGQSQYAVELQVVLVMLFLFFWCESLMSEIDLLGFGGQYRSWSHGMQ